MKNGKSQVLLLRFQQSEDGRLIAFHPDGTIIFPDRSWTSSDSPPKLEIPCWVELKLVGGRMFFATPAPVQTVEMIEQRLSTHEALIREVAEKVQRQLDQLQHLKGEAEKIQRELPALRAEKALLERGRTAFNQRVGAFNQALGQIDAALTEAAHDVVHAGRQCGLTFHVANLLEPLERIRDVKVPQPLAEVA